MGLKWWISELAIPSVARKSAPMLGLVCALVGEIGGQGQMRARVWGCLRRNDDVLDDFRPSEELAILHYRESLVQTAFGETVPARAVEEGAEYPDLEAAA